jgi:hypothetical protein
VCLEIFITFFFLWKLLDINIFWKSIICRIN